MSVQLDSVGMFPHDKVMTFGLLTVSWRRWHDGMALDSGPGLRLCYVQMMGNPSGDAGGGTAFETATGYTKGGTAFETALGV